ncbi:SLAP domain-containing protein [Lactobacillus xylocopicola]|uniref:S-layer protein C-terminal domain-containing protein n=1 Tax=Lactobacillus xylocopicola TaxID=2976676 RepID=A0ABN6SLH0_9LACO|nr:SLAP domain-containing protein [Lactobacillus xylocopicola]BDR59856.1 hypothetical protein KIM322_01170 [Lactobacillus xylocopicola]
MKISKKLILGAVAGTLALGTAIPLATTTSNTVTAATSTNKLKLAHGAYVFNKKGKRLRTYRGSTWKTHLKKGATVKFTGTIEPTERDSKRFFLLDDDNYNQSWLPYKQIKGQYYYGIGAGGYIKAGNVSQIAGKPLYTSEATVTITNMGPTVNPITTGTGNSKVILKNGKTFKVDYVYSDYGGNQKQNYYHISNTADASFASRLVKSKPKQRLATRTTNTYVSFINNSSAYSIAGILNPNSTNQISGFNKNEYVPVIEELYIWVAQDQKAELFYRLMDNSLTASINSESAALNGLRYIKVSDTKYLSGPQQIPINTAEEARLDAKTASKKDKQALQDLINQENTVKTSINYQNTDYNIYASTYNDYLNKAKDVNESLTASISEVKQTTWLLYEAQQNLLNAGIGLPITGGTMPVIYSEK